MLDSTGQMDSQIHQRKSLKNPQRDELKINMVSHTLAPAVIIKSIVPDGLAEIKAAAVC